MAPAPVPDARRPPIALDVVDLGLVSYAEGLAVQAEAVRRLSDLPAGAPATGTLFLLEHPPVITLGRNAKEANLLFPRAEIEAAGIEIHETTRGGDVTWHGPGQLVGYPVLRLPEVRRGVHAYVRDLEEALIRSLADFAISAGRTSGHPGVWVGNEKIAALGVRIARWITSHGFALNVNADLSHYRFITPCGIVGRGVTSMARLLGEAAMPDIATVKQVVAGHFLTIFGSGELDRATATPSPSSSDPGPPPPGSESTT